MGTTFSIKHKNPQLKPVHCATQVLRLDGTSKMQSVNPDRGTGNCSIDPLLLHHQLWGLTCETSTCISGDTYIPPTASANSTHLPEHTVGAGAAACKSSAWSVPVDTEAGVIDDRSTYTGAPRPAWTKCTAGFSRAGIEGASSICACAGRALGLNVSLGT